LKKYKIDEKNTYIEISANAEDIIGTTAELC
jgi:hypothetical protein